MPDEQDNKKHVTRRARPVGARFTALPPTVETRREFYEKNPKVKWAVIGIAIVSPFLGLVISGLPGVLVGLLLALISYLIGPLAATKVREIQRFHKS